jgi:hypothetical protein
MKFPAPVLYRSARTYVAFDAATAARKVVSVVPGLPNTNGTF